MEILEATSVTEVLAVIRGPKVSNVSANDIVFIFSDVCVDDDESTSLPMVLSTLALHLYTVIIVSTTARGRQLAADTPGTALLTVPASVNDVLFALNMDPINIDSIAPDFEQVEITPKNTTQQPAKPVGGSWKVPLQSEASTKTATIPKTEIQQPAVVPTQSPITAARIQKETPTATATLPRYTPNSAASDAPVKKLRPLAVAARGVNTNMQQRPLPKYPSTPSLGSRLGRVIVITAPKGGVGKSTIALNLAVKMGMCVVREGRTVCLIDANFQQADIGKYINDDPVPNICNIVDDKSFLTRDNIIKALKHIPDLYISILLGPPMIDKGDSLRITPELYSEVLELLKMHYDYIFIDTEVAQKHNAMFQKFILPQVDYMIIPVTQSYPTIFGTKDYIKSVVMAPVDRLGAGMSSDKIGIVLNQYRENVGLDVDDAINNLAEWPLIGVIPDTPMWQLAINENRVVAREQYTDLDPVFTSILAAASTTRAYPRGDPALTTAYVEEKPKNKLFSLLSRLKGRS
jgi:MinD-like ATPase involved in chromosome partitioning or flagellar assembly